MSQSTLATLLSQAGMTPFAVQELSELLPVMAPGDTTLTVGGAAYAVISGVDLGPAITANATAYTGDGYLDGWSCTAYNGGPQTVTLSEGTVAGGPVVAVITVTGVGYYPISPGRNTRLRFPGGLFATFSGGTSRTGRAAVEPA